MLMTDSYQKNILSSELILNIGGGLAIFAALVLWGGLFGLDLPTAPSFGYVRIQDILCAIGVGMIVLGIMIRGTVPTKAIIFTFLFIAWIADGVIVGLLNNNTPDNIGYETRIQIYALFGISIGSILTRNKIRTFLLNAAIIMALAMLVQWVFTLLGLNILVVSGVNLGNLFTLNVPLIRPPGGYHVVAAGLLLLLGPWSQGAYLATFLLGGAVIVSQSKTYWLLGVFLVFLRPLTKKRSWVFGVMRNGILIFIGIILTILIFNIAGSIKGINVSPIEKFTSMFDDANIQYGVIGRRQVELDYAFSDLVDQPAHILFGYGLGYSYRPFDVLFYRDDPTGQERLSLFVHNYIVWVILKFGMIGLAIVFILIYLIFAGIRRGDIYQKQFGSVFLLILIGSLVLGSFESPSGAFLFGILTAAAGNLRV
jgi:hypothetical protein